MDYINVPLFIIQSAYDIWAIPNILGIPCVKDGNLLQCTDDEKTKIEKYR